MDLALYRVVGGMNRVALGDLAADVEFYTAVKDDTGVIILTPVRVVDGTKHQTPTAPADEDETNPLD